MVNAFLDTSLIENDFSTIYEKIIERNNLFVKYREFGFIVLLVLNS